MKRGLLSAEVEDKSFSVQLTMSTDDQVATDEFESEFDEQEDSSPELEYEESDKVVHMERFRKVG